LVGTDVPLSTTGDGTVADPSGDNDEYYGSGDSSEPDVISVMWQQVEFGSGMGPNDRLTRIDDVCKGALGSGVTVVCPTNISLLAPASGWVWLDVQFSSSMSPSQVGLAWTDEGRPTFDGPDFDPNTGHNTSLEVFGSPGSYEVGGTSFDGNFVSGPSNDVMAIIRPDGVTLILSADALAGCTDPTLFVIGPGGVDTVSLPDPAGSMVTVGEPPTTTTTSTTTTTIVGSSITPAPGSVSPTTIGPASTPSTTLVAGPSSGPGSTPETSGTNPLWPIMIGLGLVMIATGLTIFLRDGGISISVPVGFEKGNGASTAAANA
jgi:hypothetical protein